MTAKPYLSQVRRHLTCSAASRRRLMGQARQMVEDFLRETPNADAAALTAAFGTPQAFAAQMLATLEPGEVDATKRRRRLVKRGLILLAISALVLAALVCFAKWQQAREVVNGDFRVIIEPGHNITEEEFDTMIQATQEQKGE